jgi:hypothetical protein
MAASGERWGPVSTRMRMGAGGFSQNIAELQQPLRSPAATLIYLAAGHLARHPRPLLQRVWLLRNDRGSHGCGWRRDRRLMQQGEKSPLIRGFLNRGGPSVSYGGRGVAFQIEDMHDAFPHRSSLVRLFDRHGLCQSSRAAVQALNRLLQLVNLNFVHV